MHNRKLTFPETVIVTEQEIDLTHVSDVARAQYIREALSMYQDWTTSVTTRRIVGIAGPSGAGKSVFVAVMKDLLAQIDTELKVVPLTIDAYHLRNELLLEKKLIDHKGRYDTYDVHALQADLHAFRQNKSVVFQKYSRKLHEPIQNGEHVDADAPALLLVEGLWLFYSEHGWKEVLLLLDQKLFLEDTPETLRVRTISRHERGGRTKQDATCFYDTSDIVNSATVLETKHLAERIITIAR